QNGLIPSWRADSLGLCLALDPGITPCCKSAATPTSPRRSGSTCSTCGAITIALGRRLINKAAATRAHIAKLWEERDALFAERASAPPDERSRIDARLVEVAREIAAFFEAYGGRAVAALRSQARALSLVASLGRADGGRGDLTKLAPHRQIEASS